MMFCFPSSATSYSWPREWNIPETSYRQVSWLIDPHTDAAFPIAQWPNGILLPIHSDEFAQVSHLFPFSPHRSQRRDTYSWLPAKLRV